MALRQPYPQDHATHLPILKAIGKTFSIKSVLEFGCGDYSTLTFLDRNFFPDLEALISFEEDVYWQAKILGAAEQDPRLIIAAEGKWSADDWDLIFIDNGPMSARIETIKKIRASGYRGLVVVHDIDYEPYKELLNSFAHRVDFTMYNPETSVCCYRADDFVGLIGMTVE